MSGIAEVLLELGFTISGSDLRLTPITQHLIDRGATVFEGHAAPNVAGAKAVVISSAVSEDNPEVQEARRLQIPVIPRGELLAELMRLKQGIAVAGSHGKTTTTSMLAAILSHAGQDPTVVVGGRLKAIGGSNARLGQSDFLVVESDESDGSFLKLSPIYAIVTNIDREHLDHYASIDEIRAAFTEFVNKVPFYGAAVLCLDDDNVQRILPDVKRRTITYGTRAQADVRVLECASSHLSSTFRLEASGEDLGRFELHVPGAHNILNATAAIALSCELGVTPEAARQALADFAGPERRFQIRGQERGITVVDDYGHHPTEIRATLAAARQCQYRRIHTIFQPHRYTRTMLLMDDFARCFYHADAVYVLDIYAASEKPIEGVSGEALAERIRAFGHRGVQYVGTLDKAIDAVLAAAEEGDLIITQGAGTVSLAGERILERLRAGV
jgi:UDP-N-acetylmuramate--alanine ligase